MIPRLCNAEESDSRQPLFWSRLSLVRKGIKKEEKKFEGRGGRGDIYSQEQRPGSWCEK